MAKSSKRVTQSPATETRPPRTKRRLRRLEEQLDHVRDVEARRGRQLERARQRSVRLEARISALLPAVDPAAGPVVIESSPGPRAFCMREKQSVSMVHPEPVVMRNGRAALSGTCPSCGAHVITTAHAKPPAGD
jgi:Domain of unknown function (DUF5679)